MCPWPAPGYIIISSHIVNLIFLAMKINKSLTMYSVEFLCTLGETVARCIVCMTG